MTLFADRIGELLEATEVVTGSKERGDLLEELASHVLGGIPGVKLTHKDVVNVHSSEEIDLVLFNQRHPEGLEVFESFIFVECKNSKTPVSSSAVRDFAYKLQSRNSSLGILVARFGITGNREDLNAAQDVISTQLREGREVVVITEKDLVELESPQDVVDLLIRRRSSLLATCGFVQDDGWREESSHEVEQGPPPEPVEESLPGATEQIGAAIRREQEQLVEEMLQLAPKLPDEFDAAAEALVRQSNEVSALVTSTADSKEIEHGRALLESMLKLGAVAVAFLKRHGAPEREPATIVDSMQSYAPNIHHIQLSSSLYTDFLGYYTVETLKEKDINGRTAALALIGLMVDSHARVEDGLYELLASPDG
jgi:hypothetical protein